MADNRNNMLEKVKERLDIVELVSEYVNLKKSGSNYLGLCPFHNEKTPSFTVSESKQIFHCFGCGAGGDGITFIMKRENLDFVDTLKFLADKYNIPWEDSTGAPASELKQIFYEINRAAARFFHNNLYTDKTALQYLKNRGIEEEVFRRFGLGYASESFDKLLINLKEDGFSESDIEKTGLIGIRKDVSGFYDKFRNRLIFPIIDTRGRVIGFGGRVLDRSLPKYLNSPDTVVFNKGYHLYGLNIIAKNKSRKRIMLVEGYMDVISLNAKGIDYAVASLGTALTEYQGKLLKRYGDEVYICYDSDAAGVRAAIRAIDVLQKLDVDPKVVMLPDGEDPDDFIKANSVAAFEKKVEESLNFMDFKVYILKKRFDLTQAEDKIKFTQEAARMIREL
ncbi:MAG: DNA primase, partial [Gudongella sp.]|nr:DNA primase [Gudongella sp.]